MGVFFINWITSLQGPTKNLLLRTLIFTAYLLVGAAIFRMIESRTGIEEKNDFDQIKQDIIDTYGINNSVLEIFIDRVRSAEAEGYWDVDFERWSFFGSLFFAATVLTTIGFGHMAPRTFSGRLFCMIYAFFGIPITGLMLKSFGEKLMDSIDVSVALIDEKLLKRERRSTAVRTSLILFTLMVSMIIFLALASQLYEGWTFFEGFYFGFVTLSTIGFGDFVPTTPHHGVNGVTHIHVALFIIVTFFYITIGLAVVSSVLVSVSRIFESKTEWEFVSLQDAYQDGDENHNEQTELLIDK
ncbi:potassium channel subfamily K member 2-like [Hydractinia symbiolongicarpus]|uniref:potassium channel subfamily K member 2-like n=1 Tax=Hydractinia symbiolongicarpus TaxID=13093 RepID=UPI00254C8F9B|nr:potassium channel subfamily K member 2-like [Hydractinia symbiolongicarpus]XP_057306658.1 potassium channel subfamily K member 2-like [Hydractinia symbiolongicarpus]